MTPITVSVWFTSVIATIPVGSSPDGVAVTPDGARVYVANLASDSISMIATATNTVTATIPVASPSLIAITPDGTRAYVTQNFAGLVSVIDTATNAVIAAIPMGPAPFAIAITSDGTRAWVGALGGTLFGIDTSTNTIASTITGVACPVGIAVTPDPLVPVTKDDCKNDGYKRYGSPAGPFRNQGQCALRHQGSERLALRAAGPREVRRRGADAHWAPRESFQSQCSMVSRQTWDTGGGWALVPSSDFHVAMMLFCVGGFFVVLPVDATAGSSPE
jgi:YVTN family beta-propeller protein